MGTPSALLSDAMSGAALPARREIAA